MCNNVGSYHKMLWMVFFSRSWHEPRFESNLGRWKATQKRKSRIHDNRTAKFTRSSLMLQLLHKSLILSTKDNQGVCFIARAKTPFLQWIKVHWSRWIFSTSCYKTWPYILLYCFFERHCSSENANKSFLCSARLL